MIMNWKGFGRKQSWPNFKVLSRHSPAGLPGPIDDTVHSATYRIDEAMNIVVNQKNIVNKQNQ
jgi:hypothetical protein